MFQDEREGIDVQKGAIWGECVGFLFAVFLCSTMLFLILTITNKIPESWSYFHILGILCLILISGWYLKKK